MADSSALGKWLTEAEVARVVDAIRRAEHGNAGEVRVHFATKCLGDPIARARETFVRLGMFKTKADTGVLLLVAPSTRKAAVFAGKGIYGAEEPFFWQRVVDAVAVGARRGELGAGVERAVDLLGDLLRRVIPSVDPAGNELPEDVTTDEEL